MKEFVKILKAKKSQEIKNLQRAANIIDDYDPERWEAFMHDQIVNIVAEDDDLAEEMIMAAIDEIVMELAIKRDPNYKPSPRERLANVLAKFLADDDAVAKFIADLDSEQE